MVNKELTLNFLKITRMYELAAYRSCQKSRVIEMQCDATLMSLELKHPYADVTENSVAYHPVIFEEAIASEVVNKLRQGGYTAYYNCKKKTIVVVLFQ